jgi:transposase
MVLRDAPYQRIETFLPGKKGDPGRTAADNRRFLEAVRWIARTGSPWRDLPERFGRWNSVYPRFARWSKKGVWQKIFEILAQDADFEEVFIDSTVVRAPPHAAGAPREKGDQALGRSRGGLSTKIHALVEGLGIMTRFRWTPCQAGDHPQALPLLEGITPGWLAADRAHDSGELLDALAARQIGAIIPPRKNRSIQRPYDRHLYKSRNLVERFFCRIKQFRRIATRYDKLAERFASFIAVCASVIWLA